MLGGGLQDHWAPSTHEETQKDGMSGSGSLAISRSWLVKTPFVDLELKDAPAIETRVCTLGGFQGWKDNWWFSSRSAGSRCLLSQQAVLEEVELVIWLGQVPESRKQPKSV